MSRGRDAETCPGKGPWSDGGRVWVVKLQTQENQEVLSP